MQPADLSPFAFFFFVWDVHLHSPLLTVQSHLLAFELQWSSESFYCYFKFLHRKSGPPASVWYNGRSISLTHGCYQLRVILYHSFYLCFSFQILEEDLAVIPWLPFMLLQHCHVFCMLLCSEIRHSGERLPGACVCLCEGGSRMGMMCMWFHVKPSVKVEANFVGL